MTNLAGLRLRPHRMVSMVLLIGLLAAVSSPSSAAADPKNAATWYRRAIDSFDRFSREDRDYVNEMADRPPTDRRFSFVLFLPPLSPASTPVIC